MQCKQSGQQTMTSTRAREFRRGVGGGKKRRSALGIYCGHEMFGVASKRLWPHTDAEDRIFKTHAHELSMDNGQGTMRLTGLSVIGCA